jgi:hypothetical protein
VAGAEEIDGVLQGLPPFGRVARGGVDALDYSENRPLHPRPSSFVRPKWDKRKNTSTCIKTVAAMPNG